MKRPMLRGLALLAILAPGGCVPYPAYRTARPEVALAIRTARQRPSPGARVTLISTTHPDGLVKTKDSVETGPDGTVRFERTRELRLEVLFLHRGPIHFWNWCVEKEGFATFFTSGPRTKM